MNKKGFPIANLILIIGVLILCAASLIEFYKVDRATLSSFSGISAIEKLNARIEENTFYKVKEVETVKEPIKENVEIESRGSLYGAVLFAQDNPLKNRRLLCADRCFEYAQLIEKYAIQYGIDPFLFFSLMMQESQGKISADSGSSVGLMQINLDNCGSYGLPQEKDNCEIILKTNPEKNIEVGAKILTEKYLESKDGRIFQGCTNRNIRYVEWAAALRGYNGWGCNSDNPEQDSFVEEVIERQGMLKGTYSQAVSLKESLFKEIEEPSFSVRLIE